MTAARDEQQDQKLVAHQPPTTTTEEDTTTTAAIMQHKNSSSLFWTSMKFAASAALLVGAYRGYNGANSGSYYGVAAVASVGAAATDNIAGEEPALQRRLQAAAADGGTPSYMSKIVDDLKERNRLFDETPPEEVKYWFEYFGPLQVSAALLEAGSLGFVF